MGALKIFTGVMALTSATVIAIKGMTDISAGIQDVRDNGIDLPDLAHVLRAVGEVSEKVTYLQDSSNAH